MAAKFVTTFLTTVFLGALCLAEIHEIESETDLASDSGTRGNLATVAEQIALESVDDRVLPIKFLVDTIESELKLIRSKYPEAGKIRHERKWTPGILVVNESKITAEQIAQVNSSYYGPTYFARVPMLRSGESSYGILIFDKPFHPVVLGTYLNSMFGIESEPEYKYGRHETITFDIANSVYNFEKGYGDCTSVCAKKWWVFFVPRQADVGAVLISSGATSSSSSSSG